MPAGVSSAKLNGKFTARVLQGPKAGTVYAGMLSLTGSRTCHLAGTLMLTGSKRSVPVNGQIHGQLIGISTNGSTNPSRPWLYALFSVGEVSPGWIAAWARGARAHLRRIAVVVGVGFGLLFGLGFGLLFGGNAWLYHYWLRRLSARGLLPRRLPQFLSWCAEPSRGWLRITDAYEFRHRELLDYLSTRGVT
jgi:hypothetical protein